jgi:hypothetical protein
LFVTGLRKNLLSVLVIEDKGFVVDFKNRQVLISPKKSSLDTTQVIGVRENNLYRLKVNLCEPCCITLRTCASCGTRGWGTCNIGLCKHAKAAFSSNKHRSKEILDLINSDVSGPMLVASITGSMYYVSFIDNLSRKTWIYFLKTKDEVFIKFQEFKALVEN